MQFLEQRSKLSADKKKKFFLNIFFNVTFIREHVCYCQSLTQDKIMERGARFWSECFFEHVLFSSSLLFLCLK